MRQDQVMRATAHPGLNVGEKTQNKMPWDGLQWGTIAPIGVVLIGVLLLLMGLG